MSTTAQPQQPSPDFWSDPVEGTDYKPEGDWEHIGRQHAPNADCHTAAGYVYFTFDPAKKHELTEPIPFELLPVNWLKEDQRYRASFGYLVRRADTEEIVAIIHQGNGWWWRFRLKQQSTKYLETVDENGWVWQTLTKCVFSRIFHHLHEK